MKKVIIILTAFLLVATIAEATPSLSVSWTLSSQTLKPNSEAVMTLTFTNAGSVEITNVFVKATPGPYLGMISNSSTELGALAIASTQQVPMILKTDDFVDAAGSERRNADRTQQHHRRETGGSHQHGRRSCLWSDHRRSCPVRPSVILKYNTNMLSRKRSQG